MRILQVNKYLYRRGGAEGYMLDLARHQRERGHEIAYFAMAHPENLDSEYSRFFPTTIELNPPPPGLIDRIRIGGSIIYRPSARRGIAQTIEEFAPDVIHAHNIYHQLSPSIFMAASDLGIPIVLTLHDYKLACPTYQFLDHGKICEACLGRRFHHAALRRCNHDSLIASTFSALELTIHTALRWYGAVSTFICPSAFMVEKMTQGRVYPDRLVHVPHFGDFTGISAATGPGRDLVFAGRLSPEKGIDIAIKALSHVPPPTRLLIAGDGPSRHELEQLANSLGLENRVEFLGRLSAEDLHALIRQAAAVVVPSRWYENQPMIVLEAYACARPVIASDLGGLSEMVDPGVTGYLVPHDDSTALGLAMAQAAASPERCHEMGITARTLASERFGIAGHMEALERIYAEARSATVTST